MHKIFLLSYKCTKCTIYCISTWTTFQNISFHVLNRAYKVYVFFSFSFLNERTFSSGIYESDLVIADFRTKASYFECIHIVRQKLFLYFAVRHATKRSNRKITGGKNLKERCVYCYVTTKKKKKINFKLQFQLDSRANTSILR